MTEERLIAAITARDGINTVKGYIARLEKIQTEMTTTNKIPSISIEGFDFNIPITRHPAFINNQIERYKVELKALEDQFAAL